MRVLPEHTSGEHPTSRQKPIDRKDGAKLDSEQVIPLDGDVQLIIASSHDGPQDEQTASQLDDLMDNLADFVLGRRPFIEATYYDSPEGAARTITSEECVVFLNPGTFRYSYKLSVPRQVKQHVVKRILDGAATDALPYIESRLSPLDQSSGEPLGVAGGEQFAFGS